MLKKVLLGLLALVLVAAGVFVWKLTHFEVDHSDVEKPSLIANGNPELIARGEYLFHAVAHCSACHLSFANYLASEIVVLSYDDDLDKFSSFVSTVYSCYVSVPERIPVALA